MDVKMNIRSKHGEEATRKRGTLSPCGSVNIEAFKNNIEHLQAIEYESAVRLVWIFFKYGKLGGRDMEALGGQMVADRHGLLNSDTTDLDFLRLPAEMITSEGVYEEMKRVERENRLRERAAIERDVCLNFLKTCEAYKLDEAESLILRILFSNYSSPLFRRLFTRYSANNRRPSSKGLDVESILFFMGGELGSQIENRKYFSMERPLVREEIMISLLGYGASDNILDMTVHLHERIARYILGDNNTYSSNMQAISRENGEVSMNQVVLPGHIKEDVVGLVDNYVKYSKKRKDLGIDGFFGYGTGLALLFYGPSGTGKTMMAKAIATRLGVQLLSLKMDSSRRGLGRYGSFDDLQKYLFMEARLTGGVVLFDECDYFLEADEEQTRDILVEIEKSECITIFATTRPVKLDPSIERRFMMKVPFTVPDVSVRERLWQTLIPGNVSLEDGVDLKAMAKDYIFTGGLIKNTIFMALNFALERSEGGEVALNREDLERAASYQSGSIFGAKDICRLYSPGKPPSATGLHSRDLDAIGTAYEKLEKLKKGLKVLISTTDTATGVEAAEEVARRCGMMVRSFQLEDLFNDRMNEIQDPITRKEVTLLDYAFSLQTGYRSSLLVIDRYGLLANHIKKSRKEHSPVLQAFFDRLKNFRGLCCLISGPIKQCIPLEFDHHIVIKYPSEEHQIRRWGEHLRDEGFTEKKIMDIVERYPMHISEIDFVAERAVTRSILKRGESLVSMEILLEVIGECRKDGSVPLLFGSRRGLRCGPGS